MKIKELFLFIKNLRYALTRHRGSIIAVLFASVVVVLVYHFSSRYSDDMDFLNSVTEKAEPTDRQKELSLDSYITESNSLKVYPEYSEDINNKISIMNRTGYLKKNPHNRSKYVYRYATGITGRWIDEKNSVVVPCGSALTFSILPGEGSVIKYYLAATSFQQKTGKRRVYVKISSRGSLLEVQSVEIDIYDRKNFGNMQKPVSDLFQEIYDSTGWFPVSLDLSKYKGSHVSVELSSTDNEGFIFVGNPVHYKESKVERYNVIHLVFDAMSRDYTGIYNVSSKLTPNMVAEQKEFIIFERFYSLATKTRIYLAGMFTSQNPPLTRHGFNDNIIPDDEKEIFYNDRSMTTLPMVLAKAGYMTLQVGNSGFTNPALPTAIDYGFSESFDFQTNPYNSTGIAYHLIKKLKEHRDKPVYIYSHFNTTHKPRITPIKYYMKGFFSNPEKIWRPNVTGATAHADAIFYQIVKALKNEGYWDKTVLIVTSDHGTLFNVDNYGRNFLLEDFVRVPFMIHLPEKLKKKFAIDLTRFKPATSVINLAPTITDIIGLGKVQEFKGKSLIPYLHPEFQDKYTDEFVRSFDNFGASIVYRGRWKYIQLQNDPSSEGNYRMRSYLFFGDGPQDPCEALYDLENDPLERKNLISSRKDIAGICRKAFLDGSTTPALNLITFFPDKDTGKKIEVVISMNNPMRRIGISPKDKGDIIQFKGNRCIIRFKLDDKKRIVYFEGSNNLSPYTMEVLSDGKKQDPESFSYGNHNLPLLRSTSDLSGAQLFHSILVTNIPEKPSGIEGLCLNISRIDIRRWARVQESGSDKKLDPGMKDVLRSWGYIQ